MLLDLLHYINFTHFFKQDSNAADLTQGHSMQQSVSNRADVKSAHGVVCGVDSLQYHLSAAVCWQQAITAQFTLHRTARAAL